MSTSTFIRAVLAATLVGSFALQTSSAISGAAHAQGSIPVEQPVRKEPTKATRPPAKSPANNEEDAERGRLRSGVTYDCERATPPQCGKSCRHDKANDICVRAGN